MDNRELASVLTRAAWKSAPAERDPHYFQTWQRVTLAVQKALRTGIPELYFRDHIERYEDRDIAYQLVVYEACRVCYGRPKTEFTYDVADPGTLPAAFRTIGRAMQTVLERIENRLRDAGREELARRYKPVLHQDILAVVRKKAKPLIGLLAGGATMIGPVFHLWSTP